MKIATLFVLFLGWLNVVVAGSPSDFFPCNANTLKSLDLYLLLDRSGSTSTFTDICTGVERINGTPAESCWDLYVDFVTELVKNLGDAIGWGDNSRGLRVSVLAFHCENNQNSPRTEYLVKSLSSNQNEVEAALDFAKKKMRPDGGSCPERAVEHIVMDAEDSSKENRPNRAFMVLSDGRFWDDKRYDEAVFRAAKALIARCVAGVAVTIEASNNDRHLKNLRKIVGDNPQGLFELIEGEKVVSQKVAKEMAVLLSSFNTDDDCSAGGLNHPAATYCGYELPADCADRPGCKWVDGGCKNTQRCDNFDTKRGCDNAKYCTWVAKKRLLGETDEDEVKHLASRELGKKKKKKKKNAEVEFSGCAYSDEYADDLPPSFSSFSCKNAASESACRSGTYKKKCKWDDISNICFAKKAGRFKCKKNKKKKSTSAPTMAPVTSSPSMAPATSAPTGSPVPGVTGGPTTSPTMAPSDAPTVSPSVSPSMAPTGSPVTSAPSTSPTIAPTTPTGSPVTSAPTWAPTPCIPGACFSQIDISLVIDRSSSIEWLNTPQTYPDVYIPALIEFVKSFDVNENDARFGGITFSGGASGSGIPDTAELVVLGSDDSWNATAIEVALIKSIDIFGGFTYTDLAIDAIAAQDLAGRRGGGIPYILFIFTDGNPSTGHEITNEMDQFSVATDFTSFSIGIGSAQSEGSLNFTDTYYAFDDFDQFRDQIANLTQIVCPNPCSD